MTAPAVMMDAPQVIGKIDAPAPDRKDIYAFYRWVVTRMETIDKAYRMGGDLLVFQELRDGKAVYVNHPFKWNGAELARGELFHPGMMEIARVAEIMQQPNQTRILVSQQEKTDRQEWARLKPIREKLAPMIEQARDFKSQAAAARNAKEAAEQAVIRFRGEQEGAEANLKKSERQIADVIKGIEI